MCVADRSGPLRSRPNDNLQWSSSCLSAASARATVTAATATTIHLHLFQARNDPRVVSPIRQPAEPAVYVVPLPRSCPPFDYVIPRVPSAPAHPLLAPNPLIIFTRRSDSPAPRGPIPFTFHYELAAIPAIEPATFFSSRLCRGHLHLRRLVSVLPDRRRCLRSVIGWSSFLSVSLARSLFPSSLSLAFSLCPSSPTSDPRHRRCMCDPQRLPDGSGISEFPRAC